jgi:hypothetical protein
MKAKPPPALKCQRGKAFQSGPGATRTRDLLLRRQALYPTELRTRRSGGGKLAQMPGLRNQPMAGRRASRSSRPTVSVARGVATGLATARRKRAARAGGSSYDRGARI